MKKLVFTGMFPQNVAIIKIALFQNNSIFMIITFLSYILLWQEKHAESLLLSPMQTLVEETLINLASWLKLGIEAIGAIIILVGIAHSIYALAQKCTSTREQGFTKIRLLLARYLVLALEFQLAADILSTAIAPTWEQIGKLSAIAVVRTILNYFLVREMKEERKLIDMENTVLNVVDDVDDVDDKDESKI